MTHLKRAASKKVRSHSCTEHNEHACQKILGLAINSAHCILFLWSLPIITVYTVIKLSNDPKGLQSSLIPHNRCCHCGRGTGHDVKLCQHELHKICNIPHMTYQRQLKQITAGTCLQLGSISLLTAL